MISFLKKIKRKLINRDEEKISWLQLTGFLLIIAGILYMVFSLLFFSMNAQAVAITFFNIMLGIAFAFPDVVKNNSGRVSITRIVLFMLVNVTGMLLLKIGWNKSNFGDIGLDGYWIAVIGFLVAAALLQSFFESRAIGKASANSDNGRMEKEKAAPGMRPLSIQGNSQQAIYVNSEKLINDHPTIKRLIPSYYSDGNSRIPCVDICITDNAKQNIPSYLEYKNGDGKIIRIKTRVITNFGNVKPHVGRGNTIANDNTRSFPGTTCCILKGREPGLRYLLTCNHVMTGGKFENPGKLGAKVVKLFFGNEFDDVGTWEFGKMDGKVDAAIIKIEKTERIDPNDVDPSIYTVSEADLSSTEIELKGAFSKTKRAFIIHIKQPIEVDYKNKTVEMTDLITLSMDLNHFNFTPPTRKGDSGALVYHADTRQPIGMIVGANSQFSFVIPFQTIVDAFPDLQLKILDT